MNSIEIKSVGKIIISKELQREIDYLHSKIQNQEWSGILVYETVTRDISAMENLVFIGKHIFLMDIGKSASTEFSYDKGVVEMYDSIPDIDNIGMIHTHHNMGAFLSSTDITDLVTNASSYNYYISLVVALNKNYVCKIAFPSRANSTTNIEMTGYDGRKFEKVIAEESSSVIISPLTVHFEESADVDSWFEKRYKAMKDRPVAPLSTWKKDEKKDNKGIPIYSDRKSEKSKWDADDTKDKVFLASLLSGWEVLEDDVEAFTTDQIIDSFHIDESTFDIVGPNISIIHDNVYGARMWMDETRNVKKVIASLSRYKKSADVETRKGIEAFVKCLESYKEMSYGSYY